MSGTSLDGIDAAAVEVCGAGDDIQASLAAFVSLAYDSPTRAAIADACGPASSARDLTLLHALLGRLFAEAAERAVHAAGWEDADAVGSHGQTVWHQPDDAPVGGATARGTLQLGDPSAIAERLHAPVVSDFRARDMAVGGEGAPLVPLVDWLLYRRPDASRALQNIGGIGNVTYLSAGCALDDVLAFDTGPGVMVIDEAARLLSDGALPFDVDGAMAAAGTVRREWLIDLLDDPWYRTPPPKSTGREVFGKGFARAWVDRCRRDGGAAPDIVATATALTAESIANAYRDFLPGPPDEVIITGGGARNPVLVAMLRQRLSMPVRTADQMGWNGDAKEAVAFAVLADRTMQGLPGNVPRATGASRPVVLGNVTPP
jgi:anhydro-N-acetylmuramic acid kinase